MSGGGGKLPPTKYLVTFPGGYKTEDPGLNVDLYDPRAVNITHYDIPGPGERFDTFQRQKMLLLTLVDVAVWSGQQD